MGKAGRKRAAFSRWWFKAAAWARRNIPPGLRTLVGVLLILGGLLGFLPILGFWMLPLGLVLVWVDLRRVWQFIRRRSAGGK